MLVSLRFPEPRGVQAKTAYDDLYAKTAGETRELLAEAHRKLTERYGAAPSNSLLLRDVLRTFAAYGPLGGPEAVEPISPTKRKTKIGGTQ